jgi:hypothetical protein
MSILGKIFLSIAVLFFVFGISTHAPAIVWVVMVFFYFFVCFIIMAFVALGGIFVEVSKKK